MNVNLMTIAALSVSSSQPAGGHSTNKAGRLDDVTATSAGDNQVASDKATNRTGDTDNEVSDKAPTTSSTNESQASQNDDTQTKVTDKTGGRASSDFNKVLKKRLKHDETETNHDAEQDTAQSAANDPSQTAQVCSLPVIKVDVAAPGQQQPAEDVSTQIQPIQIIPQANQPAVQINQNDSQSSRYVSQNDQTIIRKNQSVSQLPVQAISPQTQTVDNGVQVASQDTQRQVIKLDELQQTKGPVSDETQAQIQNSTNTAQATESTTQQMPQVAVMNQRQQQGQEQTQLAPVQMTSTSTVNSQDVAGTTQENIDNNTAKSDFHVNSAQADSNKPVAASSQDNLNFNENVVSTDSVNQTVSGQSKTDFVDLASTTTNQNGDTNYVPITTAAVGQQTGKTTTTHNNSQNKSYNNQQDNPLLSTNSQVTLSTVNGLAAEFDKAGIETVSLYDTVSQPQTKSQTNSLSVQSLGLQAMTTATAGHIADAQSVIASHSTAGAHNTSTQDTTASLREQICMSVQNSIQQGQHQITINLNPPELGRVSIKFTEQGGQLTGSLEVTNSQTRADIQQAIPEMLRSLEQSGISIKRIDVSLSDVSGQSSHDFSRESASHNQWEQLAQQSFDDTNSSRFSQDSYVASSRFSGASEFGGDTVSDWNQSYSSKNLLNVLI